MCFAASAIRHHLFSVPQLPKRTRRYSSPTSQRGLNKHYKQLFKALTILERSTVTLDRSHRRAIYTPCSALQILKNCNNFPPPPPCPFWTEPFSFTPCLSQRYSCCKRPLSAHRSLNLPLACQLLPGHPCPRSAGHAPDLWPVIEKDAPSSCEVQSPGFSHTMQQSRASSSAPGSACFRPHLDLGIQQSPPSTWDRNNLLRANSLLQKREYFCFTVGANG